MSEPSAVEDLVHESTTIATCSVPGCGRQYEATVVAMGDRRIANTGPCPDCRQENERKLAQAREARRRLDADVLARERIEQAEQKLAVPPLYGDVTLETFPRSGTAAQQARQAALVEMGRRYVTDWPRVQSVLLLLGPSGTGKTGWSWAVMRALVARHAADIERVKCADLVRRLRASWRSKDAESEERVLAGFQRRELLVIEELSSHAFYGQQIHQHLYDVLDERIEQRRPTILLSNETLPSVTQILRPALMDRLAEHGAVVTCDWPSFRGTT